MMKMQKTEFLYFNKITLKLYIMNTSERIENFKRKYDKRNHSKIEYVRRSKMIRLENENKELKNKIKELEDKLLWSDVGNFQDLGR